MKYANLKPLRRHLSMQRFQNGQIRKENRERPSKNVLIDILKSVKTLPKQVSLISLGDIVRTTKRLFLIRYSYENWFAPPFRINQLLRAGQCVDFPGWNTINCPKSCGFCHLRDPTIRCSFEALNVSAGSEYRLSIGFNDTSILKDNWFDYRRSNISRWPVNSDACINPWAIRPSLWHQRPLDRSMGLDVWELCLGSRNWRTYQRCKYPCSIQSSHYRVVNPANSLLGEEMGAIYRFRKSQWIWRTRSYFVYRTHFKQCMVRCRVWECKSWEWYPSIVSVSM